MLFIRIDEWFIGIFSFEQWYELLVVYSYQSRESNNLKKLKQEYLGDCKKHRYIPILNWFFYYSKNVIRYVYK